MTMQNSIWRRLSISAALLLWIAILPRAIAQQDFATEAQRLSEQVAGLNRAKRYREPIAPAERVLQIREEQFPQFMVAKQAPPARAGSPASRGHRARHA